MRGSGALYCQIKTSEEETGVTPEALVGVAMKMTDENIPGNSEITMDDVKNLIKKKDEIEEQIKAYYDVLQDVSRRSYY